MHIFFTAVPEDAPLNIQVTSNSSSSVLVSWTPPSTPNGVVTTYNLYINYSDGSSITRMQISGAAVNYTVSGLQPYQLVSVSISASTAAGEGPTSEVVTGRSMELGMLNILSVQEL